MKRKISITIEEEIHDLLEDKLKDGLFRNKSHLLEYAVRRFLKDE